LRAYKKLQYDKGTLAAELQETKAKLKTAEIDRINDFEDQNILRQELVQEKAELKVELAELDIQYDALKDEVEEVKDENDDLKEVNQELKRQVKGLEQEVKKGVKSFDAYKKRVRALGNEM
jgi:FtsZ-binding cell division protein ZapB